MAAERLRGSLFKQLTRLFRSGPVIKRKVMTHDTTVASGNAYSSAASLISRTVDSTYSAITSNAFHAAERLTRYQDFNEMEMCLSGDTKVAVPGGFKTMKQLVDEFHGKEFVVYTYDRMLKMVIPSFAKNPRKTCEAEMWEVKLSDGRVVKGTGNHRLMCRDGVFVEIQNMKPGMKLMPFDRRDGNVYVNNSLNFGSSWPSEAELLSFFVLGRPLRKREIALFDGDVSIENLVVEAINKQGEKRVVFDGKKNWTSKVKAKWLRESIDARSDVTFGRILEVAHQCEFELEKLCWLLDVKPEVVFQVISSNGYSHWNDFKSSYCVDDKHSMSSADLFQNYENGMKKDDLAAKIKCDNHTLTNLLFSAGYCGFDEFTQMYHATVVKSVKNTGKVIDMYDITVDGHKCFGIDGVISHNTAEICSALDIMADETVAQDESGRTLHIYSDNPKIKSVLEDLFYNTLNVEFNARPWARNLCKYGDMYILNDVHPEYGLINAYPIPVNEIERIENWNPNDPSAVKFKWITANKDLENWEISHFRILGNDMFLPYGTSMIDGARKIWRQLILIEDAMLIYRIVRAPDRTIFYVDVGAIPAEEVPTYMEQLKQQIKMNEVVDRATGRVDLRHNPMSVTENYYIPVRGSDSATKIENLAGGQNVAAVEDVAYMQKKLFAALKVPKAFLGYEEMIGSKSTLASVDIRFSRTVAMIQRTMIAELNKMAIIHLYCNGFDGEDLVDFTLRFSNPSSIAQQQKLELYRTKFEIAASMPENLLNQDYLRKNVLGLTSEEIENIKDGLFSDKEFMKRLEGASDLGESAESGGDIFGGAEIGGGEELAEPEQAVEEPAEEITANDDEDEDIDDGMADLLMSSDNIDDMDLMSEKDVPVKVQYMRKFKKNRSRRKHSGPLATEMPDFKKSLSLKDDSFNPHGSDHFRSVARMTESNVNTLMPVIPENMKRMLSQMSQRLNSGRKILMRESEEVDIDLNVENLDD